MTMYDRIMDALNERTHGANVEITLYTVEGMLAYIRNKATNVKYGEMSDGSIMVCYTLNNYNSVRNFRISELTKIEIEWNVQD